MDVSSSDSIVHVDSKIVAVADSQLFMCFINRARTILYLCFSKRRPKAPLPRLRSSLSRFLICFARQVEVWENAVDVRCHDLARRADIGFVELVPAGHPEQ